MLPGAWPLAEEPLRAGFRSGLVSLDLEGSSVTRRKAEARRKPWSPRSCDYMVTALRQVLAQLVAEGYLTRNVALLVDRVPGKAKRFETFTAKQVQVVLDGISTDRNRHAWHMALAGMRRGEIAGQRALSS